MLSYAEAQPDLAEGNGSSVGEGESEKFFMIMAILLFPLISGMFIAIAEQLQACELRGLLALQEVGVDLVLLREGAEFPGHAPDAEGAEGDGGVAQLGEEGGQAGVEEGFGDLPVEQLSDGLVGELDEVGDPHHLVSQGPV